MLRQPRRLIALTLVVLAAFPILLDAAPRATIHPADAPLHEGQRVRVAGAVQDLHIDRAGNAHITIAADGHGLPARVEGTLEGIPLGSWIEARGVLLRSHGTLRLHVDTPDHLHTATPPGPQQPPWDQLARNPAAWTGRLIALTGTLDGEHLHGPSGHRLTLGDGPWPPHGRVHAQGILAYQPHCLCHVLHATHAVLQETPAWTP